MTSRERAKQIINELPLSKIQRDLYLSGLEKMSEKDVKDAIKKLEAALSRGSKTLKDARKLLKKRLNKK